MESIDGSVTGGPGVSITISESSDEDEICDRLKENLQLRQIVEPSGGRSVRAGHAKGKSATTAAIPGKVGSPVSPRTLLPSPRNSQPPLTSPRARNHWRALHSFPELRQQHRLQWRKQLLASNQRGPAPSQSPSPRSSSTAPLGPGGHSGFDEEESAAPTANIFRSTGANPGMSPRVLGGATDGKRREGTG